MTRARWWGPTSMSGRSGGPRRSCRSPASMSTRGCPSTRYADGEFDLIINHSVFTHLDEHYQDRWLEELQRIAAPGGVLVLSTRGEHAFSRAEQQLAPTDPNRRQWREILERDGIFWSSLEFQDQVVLRRPTEGCVSTPIRARRSRGDAPPRACGCAERARCAARPRGSSSPPASPPTSVPAACSHGSCPGRRARSCTPSFASTVRSPSASPRSKAVWSSGCRRSCARYCTSRPNAIERLDRELEQTRSAGRASSEEPAERPS